ncbi:hypothetical protein NGM10_07110 [Halorussus salilacus]|uniref:hypothetical protein n=1 Tax=Halorussus salilacus TaxID=2953750 RepID=UPI00209DFAAE|nr:hypothetical protein [Halorussus salilacus]USZ69496.1 hypothetical protein NGM10_07110 [Halorussus salilacus]
MSRSTNVSEALPETVSATEALENAVEESRREYDKKVETMEEIDDKAMRSVRTAVILLGLVVSAISVKGPNAVGERALLPILVGGIGVSALALSISYGIGTYSATQYPTGIGTEHRTEVTIGDYSRDEWFVNMLDEYDNWSDEIAEEVAKNVQYLETVQFCLSFGVISLLSSSSVIVLHVAYGIPPLGSFVAIVVLISLGVSQTNLYEGDEHLS